MKISKFLILAAILSFSMKPTFSQDLDSLYGLNPILYNGQLYTYYVPKAVLGHQYLHSENFKVGTITINQEQFDSVLLNYDIHNQEILLSFKFNQQNAIIKLFKGRINSFSIGKESFELVLKDQNEYTIYEVIGEGNYKILQHWRKWLEVSNSTKVSTHAFTKPFKTMYLKFNNRMIKFRNNRTLLSSLTDTNKQQVKEYLKQKKLKVKKASHNELYKLTEFCNSL